MVSGARENQKGAAQMAKPKGPGRIPDYDYYHCSDDLLRCISIAFTVDIVVMIEITAIIVHEFLAK